MACYYIEKRGLEAAIDHDFPDTLGKDPEIAAARVQMRNAERAILARIQELQAEKDGDDD
jgi:hypothetical protein